MTVTLYTIKDDRKKLEKTLNAANTIATITAHYKQDTDVLEPVFELAYNASYVTCNYIYVADWNRYYFVEKPITGSQRLYFKCKVDVLQSYATDIKKLDCIIARQKDEYNAYLNDGVWRNLQARDVLTKRFSKSGHYTSLYQPCNFILTTGGEV